MNQKSTLQFSNTSDFLAWRQRQNGSLGFVPTMGALHPGHSFLIEKSIRENTHTVVSIFVNPTQFNQPEDLAKYPRTWEDDLKLCSEVGATAVFAPAASEMYPDNYKYRLSESEVSKVLCGEFRPGHFEGMLTIVLKLLLLVNPTRAYFGEKDYQQLQLVKGMVDSFFVPTQIVGVPTVRLTNGLALSSRNERLTAEQKAIAPELAKLCQQNLPLSTIKEQLLNKGFRVEYLEEKWDRRLVAAWLGEIRLIDNFPVAEIQRRTL